MVMHDLATGLPVWKQRNIFSALLTEKVARHNKWFAIWEKRISNFFLANMLQAHKITRAKGVESC